MNTIIDVDHNSIRIKQTELAEKVAILNEAVAVRIKYNVSDSNELLSSLKEKSGFENTEMVLNLYNANNDYKILKEAEKVELKYYEFKNNKYNLKSNLNELLTNEFSYRLSDTDQLIYNEIQVIADYLNKNLKDSYSNLLIKSNGKWQVNAIALNNRMY